MPRDRAKEDRAVGILARRLRCASPEDFRDWAKRAPKGLSAVELFRLFCGDCARRFRREQGVLGNCLRDNGLKP